FEPGAMLNAPPAYSDFVRSRGRFLPQPGNALDRLLQTKEVVYSADVAAEAVPTPSARLGGARCQVIVPMLKDGALVGAIAIYRQEVRAFADKQIELVTTFADQAVIAIENTRLFEEIQARTGELSEALEQQTATSEVLQVISSSPGALDPVFDTMLANAIRICEATFGALYRFEGDAVRAATMLGVPPPFAEFWRSGPHRPGPRTALGRLAATRQTVHIVDVMEDPAYVGGEAVFVAAVKLGGFRTMLVVP